jgi:hypothetical protein
LKPFPIVKEMISLPVMHRKLFYMNKEYMCGEPTGLNILIAQ